jgi:signal peptidase I
VKGFGSIKRNDIVVFNFPAGDTVALRMQNPDYYMLVHDSGREKIHALPDVYGKVIYRPVDKRENFVKRCIGMPGDNLQLIENQVYINGEKMKNPQKMQLSYYVETDGTYFTEEQFRAFEISKGDRKMVAFDKAYHHSLLETIGFEMDANSQSNQVYLLPLTEKAVEMVRKLPFVKQVVLDKDMWSGVYPVGYDLGWTRDNYGPVWIPQKGQTIELNPHNLALYTRCIVNYENNTLETLPDGKIRINGQEATTYTFRYDYYFMLGDNRHNSADSRMWGFVPEDHIVGKPLVVWLSLDKDRNLLNGGIRWNRMFRKVSTE